MIKPRLSPEEIKRRKKVHNDTAYAREKGITLEQLYELRKIWAKTRTGTGARAASLRYQAKCKGMTLEEYMAHREMKTGHKEKVAEKKERVFKSKQKQKFLPQGGFTPEYILHLKEKHKEHEGKRLAKSINKPVFLNVE